MGGVRGQGVTKSLIYILQWLTLFDQKDVDAVVGDEYGDTRRVTVTVSITGFCRKIAGVQAYSPSTHRFFSLLCPEPFFTPGPNRGRRKHSSSRQIPARQKTKQTKTALYVMLFFRDSCQSGTQQLPTTAAEAMLSSTSVAEAVQLDSIQVGAQQTTLSLVVGGGGVFSFLCPGN